MALWTSKLPSYDDIQKAIYSEVEFIHSNKLVKQACFVYSIAMHTLLKNHKSPDRGKLAFNEAYRLS